MEMTKYICKCCGKEIDEWPSLTFNSPDNYTVLSEEDKENIAMISDDMCVIQHPDQVDRFARVTLTQKVTDHCTDLDYGLWVSLSEKSFDDYYDNYNNENHVVTYFGWLCNDIWDYEFDKSIPMTIYTQPGNRRPIAVPHDDFDHPFVRDYYNGITKAEAEKRIHALLHA